MSTSKGMAGTRMVTCNNNGHSQPHIKDRNCINPVELLYRLPKGWRWLRLGEWVQEGDYLCDPRAKPVKIIVNGAWKMTDSHHPVRRKKGIREISADDKWATKTATKEDGALVNIGSPSFCAPPTELQEIVSVMSNHWSVSQEVASTRIAIATALLDKPRRGWMGSRGQFDAGDE